MMMMTTQLLERVAEESGRLVSMRVWWRWMRSAFQREFELLSYSQSSNKVIPQFHVHLSLELFIFSYQLRSNTR